MACTSRTFRLYITGMHERDFDILSSVRIMRFIARRQTSVHNIYNIYCYYKTYDTYNYCMCIVILRIIYIYIHEFVEKKRMNEYLESMTISMCNGTQKSRKLPTILFPGCNIVVEIVTVFRWR
jgi:hypothetical protein